MVGNNPGNNKSWSELVPRRLVSLPTPTSLTVEPAREEGTLCKKHHQRREQHELNTDNVDKSTCLSNLSCGSSLTTGSDGWPLLW